MIFVCDVHLFSMDDNFLPLLYLFEGWGRPILDKKIDLRIRNNCFGNILLWCSSVPSYRKIVARDYHTVYFLTRTARIQTVTIVRFLG